MLGRHIAADPRDPHCIQSRQCYASVDGSNIQDVCNNNLAQTNPAEIVIQNGNEVCGAFWTDELLVATCGTRPFAERYSSAQLDFFRDYKCAHLHLAHTPCLAASTFNYDTMSEADRQYCQEQHPRIPGAWTRRLQIGEKAVGGIPMIMVDTGVALGLIGFEIDLTGCDHFDEPSTDLEYVGRVNSAVDTCEKVCISVTGIPRGMYNEYFPGAGARQFPFDEHTGIESEGGNVVVDDWKLEVSCPEDTIMWINNSWTWMLQPGGEGLVTTTACFANVDATLDNNIGDVLQKIDQAAACEYTVYGPPEISAMPLVASFVLPQITDLKEELDPLPVEEAHA